MATPALLTRTSRASTASTARWICDALVTSSVRTVTRSSAMSNGPRLPANTLLAPLRIASLTSARPMPRFAPVIRTVLFAMSIPLWLRRVMGEISFTPFYGSPSAKDTWAGSPTEAGYRPGSDRGSPSHGSTLLSKRVMGADPIAGEHDDIEADPVEAEQ